MPAWGLTTTNRQARPYGLDPWWLEPGKVVTDPIHGDVYLTRIEQLMLDTPPMQRLRRVRQLGTTHLVYPGATHTRLSHSLGAVRVVQTLFDAAHDQRNQNHPVADLFSEWEKETQKAEADPRGITREVRRLAAKEGEKPWQMAYQRKVAEATVLARLGALLHDIGHLPFGHTIEDDLKLLTPHDEGSGRLKSIWDEVIQSWAHQLEQRNLREPDLCISDLLGNLTTLATGRLFRELQWLILSSQRSPEGDKQSAAANIQYPFVADMVGNTICADLLDYLERDHVFTGLPLSLGKRYLSSFYVTPALSGGLYPERMALAIARNGRERTDVVTEILKHLRYRYELQERVLVHHTKLAADAMVGKMFELWLEGTEAELLQRSRGQSLNRAYADIPPEFKDAAERAGATNRKAKASCVARFNLETLLRRHGDDGVLESISGQQQTDAHAASAELAAALLSRDLYKPAANAFEAAAAADLYDKHGSHAARRNLEIAACTHAGITDTWHVVIWIPDPRMRLKLAELLVDDGHGVAKFKDKSPRGSDIYEAHKDLWTISVFVHPSVTPEQTASALAKLSQMLTVSWDTHRPELGPDPSAAPEHLGAFRFLHQTEEEEKVRQLVAAVQSDQLAARGERATQSELDAEISFIGERLGITVTKET